RHDHRSKPANALPHSLGPRHSTAGTVRSIKGVEMSDRDIPAQPSAEEPVPVQPIPQPTVARCPNGHEVPPNAAFCPVCGAHTVVTVVEPTPEQADPGSGADPIHAKAKTKPGWRDPLIAGIVVVVLLAGILITINVVNRNSKVTVSGTFELHDSA